MNAQRAVIVGCGGIGGIVAHGMANVIGPKNIVLIDRDKVEKRNIEGRRQAFAEESVGKAKAQALAESLNITLFFCEYFTRDTYGDFDLRKSDRIFCCVDNHPGRLAVLEACDSIGCEAYVMGNELFEAEAYWYSRELKDTPNDPRLVYPEMNTDTEDDPSRPGCIVEQKKKGQEQLLIANQAAAVMGYQLWWFHNAIKTSDDGYNAPDVKLTWPVHTIMNSRFRSILLGDRLTQGENS